MKEYRSNGKLLITGEYMVLDGATAFAIPSKLGQTLIVEETQNIGKLEWVSYLDNGEIWFSVTIDLQEYKILSEKNTFSERLLQVLLASKELGGELPTDKGYRCTTKLDFPKDWGLGSSSTFLANIAQWLEVDPYALLENTFGGSGYDLACALAKEPITYKLSDEGREIDKVKLSKEISDRLGFVYLNQKQDSRDGIKLYRAKGKSEELVQKVSIITKEILKSDCSFEKFSKLMIRHENILSKHLGITTVKELLFSDYQCFIKSLGAWGGDFVMIEYTQKNKEYFKQKGYSIVLNYKELLY